MDKKRFILTVCMLVGYTIGINGCGENPNSTEEMQADPDSTKWNVMAVDREVEGYTPNELYSREDENEKISIYYFRSNYLYYNSWNLFFDR